MGQNKRRWRAQRPALPLVVAWAAVMLTWAPAEAQPERPRAAAAPAAATVAPPPPETRALIARGHADTLVRWTRQVLEVPAELALDPELRLALRALIDPFPESMRPAYERWSLEGQARAGADPTGRAVWAGLSARFHNALTTWRLRDGGVAHEAALRAAALAPAVCRRLVDAQASWPEIASMLQQLPPAQRAEALAGEARLLAAWDAAPQPYPMAPDAPVPGADIRRWVEGWRQGVASPLPLPPALAGRLLPEPPRAVVAPHRCALRQWWLGQRLQALGPAPAAEATAPVWRAWRLLLAQDMAYNKAPSEPFPTPEGSADYPAVARYIEMTGVTVVEVTLDARGRYADARILERRLVLGGLPPGTPLPALEHLLDGASLAKAREVIDAQAAAAERSAAAAATAPAQPVPPRGKQVTLELVWKLD